MKEIHLTRKDFKIEWYSGSGAGGQHRNKHQNCCRITHIESGICERGTESKSRTSNQKTSFTRLAKRVISWVMVRDADKKEINTEVIRNYNEPRNEVHDKASGLKMPYTEIVVSGNIDKMVAVRRLACV
jgi:protein subunit release factor A